MDNHADFPRQQQAEYHAGNRPQHAGHHALHHENFHNAARRQPQRAQNGNVGLFLVHRHHQ